MCIFFHLSTLRWHMWLKYFPMEDKYPLFLHCLYRGNWWPGDARNKSTGTQYHGIFIAIPEYPMVSNTEIKEDLINSLDRVTHTCVGKRTIVGWDNGLSPGRRQSIILTNAGILLIGPLGTNFNGILNEIHTVLFKKIHFKCSLENISHFVSTSMC